MPCEHSRTESIAPDDVKLARLARYAGILRFFNYGHLPHNLACVSAPFYELAHELAASLEPSAETSVALRKLLESKDAAVRAALP